MSSQIRAMGVVRAAVGVALLAAPRAIGRSDDPSFALLMRTIGVRDLVLGVGAATASGPAAPHWGRAVLASDSIDVIVGTAAIPKVGVGGGLVAALLPVPFVLADVWALRNS
jgi:hypothetical protein